MHIANVYAGAYAFNLFTRQEVNVIAGENITSKERPLSELYYTWRLFLFMFEPYASYFTDLVCIPIGFTK